MYELGMESKIVFLGTAGDVFVSAKQHRASGGMVVQVADYQFHIDPGPGAIVRAMQNGVNVRANTAVLVSNSKLLNSHDVDAIVGAMTYDGFDKKGVMICEENVLSDASLREETKTYVERIITPTAGQKIGIEQIEIHALETKNETPTIGYKFLTPDFVLSYLGETGYSKDLLKQYDYSDILIMNMTDPKTDSKNELDSENIIKIIEHVKPSLVILTHFGKGMIQADPLYVCRDIQKRTSVQIIAATDGLMITPPSYSANIKQKTLNLYSEDEVKEVND